MIETESQRQAAASWLEYWKASSSAGEQSWFGQQQAQEIMMALHERIDVYDKRVAASSVDLQSDGAPARD